MVWSNIVLKFVWWNILPERAIDASTGRIEDAVEDDSCELEENVMTMC